MSFEFIRRKEGEMSQKQEIRHSNVQVSINDWGHLVIRAFDKPEYEENCEYGREKCEEKNGTMICETFPKGYCKCEYLKKIRVDEEHLIVFDKATTDRIINFIFSIRTPNFMKQLLENILKGNYELPF